MASLYDETSERCGHILSSSSELSKVIISLVNKVLFLIDISTAVSSKSSQLP